MPGGHFFWPRTSQNSVGAKFGKSSFSMASSEGLWAVEVEARWRLVETAWSLDISPRLLVARYDPTADGTYVELRSMMDVDGMVGRIVGALRALVSSPRPTSSSPRTTATTRANTAS